MELIFALLYDGYGIKRSDVCFNPTKPPEIQRDPVYQGEKQVPTPLTAPELLPEPDTEAEKKMAEGEEDE